MARLTKEQILAAPLATEEVTVDSWGGSVLISEMPVVKRKQMLSELIGPDGKQKPVDAGFELTLFLAGVVDPEFSLDDARELQAVSGAAIGMVAERILALNGLNVDAQDEARGKS